MSVPTLPSMAREFVRHPSPWMIASALAGAVTLRVLTGVFVWTDAVVPVVLVAFLPVSEWLIHIGILHWRPRKLGGITLDSLLARKHREHHADPRNVPLVFIPWQALCWILPLEAATALLAFPRAGLGLTFLVSVLAILLGYEWTHFLIHSDYRPHSAPYKAIWRNHRLHHYKNEHFWLTVTTTGTADRLFGTYPDPATVTTSRTAKNLYSLID